MIWKYILPLADEAVIPMPKGAHVLDVQAQRNEICMWALVDPGAERVDRAFAIRATGAPVGAVGSYVGTVQTNNEMFVWHIFEAATT